MPPSRYLTGPVVLNRRCSEQHGVFTQLTPAGPSYPAVRRDEDGYYPSVFQAPEKCQPSCKTAFYHNWKPLAYPFNEKIPDEIALSGKRRLCFHYHQAFQFVKKHRYNPTVVFLYSVHTDHAGHKYGWMSREYLQSIEEADQQIGIFFQKLRQEDLFNDTHFLFLT